MPGCGPGVPAAVVVAPRLTTAGGVHEEPYPATRARSSSAPRSTRRWSASWQAVLIRHGGPGFRSAGVVKVEKGAGAGREVHTAQAATHPAGHWADRSALSRVVPAQFNTSVLCGEFDKLVGGTDFGPGMHPRRATG
jgi:hypothetical protein